MQSFEVSGITCNHRVRVVTEAIKDVDAAAQVAVDLGAGRVTVRDGTASLDRIVEALMAEGYPARPLAA